MATVFTLPPRIEQGSLIISIVFVVQWVAAFWAGHFFFPLYFPSHDCENKPFPKEKACQEDKDTYSGEAKEEDNTLLYIHLFFPFFTSRSNLSFSACVGLLEVLSVGSLDWRGV